jgi:hypothetical protein
LLAWQRRRQRKHCHRGSVVVPALQRDARSVQQILLGRVLTA